MFVGVDALVRRLVRVRIGSLRLDERLGDVRRADHAEVRRLASDGPGRGLIGSRLPALSSRSNGPADVVTQPLVVEDESADGLRQLVALPLHPERPAASPSPSGCCSADGPDGIGSRAELVRRDVAIAAACAAANAACRGAPVRSRAAALA